MHRALPAFNICFVIHELHGRVFSNSAEAFAIESPDIDTCVLKLKIVVAGGEVARAQLEDQPCCNRMECYSAESPIVNAQRFPGSRDMVRKLGERWWKPRSDIG